MADAIGQQASGCRASASAEKVMTMMRRVGSERGGRGKSVLCPREGTPLEEDLPAAGGRLGRCNRTAGSGCRASASAEAVMTMMRRVGSERWGRGKSVVCPREGTPLEDDLPAAGGRLDRCNRTAASGCRASASAETVMWRGRWRGRPLDVTARRGRRPPRRVQRTGERGRQSARCGGRRSRRTRPRAPLVELSRGASLVGGGVSSSVTRLSDSDPRRGGAD